MTPINWRSVVKGVALIGALLTGGALIYGGDVQNGVGVIAAAFASAPHVVKDE